VIRAQSWGIRRSPFFSFYCFCPSTSPLFIFWEPKVKVFCWGDKVQNLKFKSIFSISSYLWNEVSELTLPLFVQFIATQVTISKEFPYFQIFCNRKQSEQHILQSEVKNTELFIICFGRLFQIHQLTQCFTLNAPCSLYIYHPSGPNQHPHCNYELKFVVQWRTWLSELAWLELGRTWLGETCWFIFQINKLKVPYHLSAKKHFQMMCAVELPC